MAIIGVSTLLLQRRVTGAFLLITEETAPAVLVLEQLTMHAARMEGEALGYGLLLTTLGQGGEREADAAYVEHELSEYQEAKRNFSLGS